MKRFGMLKALKIIVLVALALTVFGFVTEHLWNWLMPSIFGLKTISFAQALGLVVLSKVLLGGFHKHGGGHKGWKNGMQDRWARMTPEERERFREGMRGRRGFTWGPGGMECWDGRGEGPGGVRGEAAGAGRSEGSV